MKRSHYIIRGLALAISMPSCLQAQTTQPKDTTMTRTVVVEQEYNPDIMDASKVNVLPKVEEPTVSKKEVEYATTFFPATSVPAGLMRTDHARNAAGDARFLCNYKLHKHTLLSLFLCDLCCIIVFVRW